MISASKVTIIQASLSILLVISAPIAMYLIHRSRSEPVQPALYAPEVSAGTTENSQDEADDLQPETHVLEPAPLGSPSTRKISPKDRNSPVYPADLADRVKSLKYDGYMQVTNARVAWLSDGETRALVKEGDELHGIIKIEKIHENSVTVSAADGSIIREIPFTRRPGEQISEPPPSRAAIIQNRTSRTTPQRTMTTTIPQSKSADNRSPLGSPSTRKKVDRPPSPPASRSDAPPVPVRPARIASPNSEKTRDNSRNEAVVYVDPGSEIVESAGETFTIQVKINNGANIFAVPLDINYNPDVLEVTGLREGSYMKKDGGQTTFLTSLDKNRGKITVGLTRLGRVGGVSGSGTLMYVDFRAVKPGATSLSFTNARPVDSGLSFLPMKFVPGKVRVQ